MNYKRNIRKLVDKIQDVDMVEGIDWYKKARIFCLKTSQKYNVPYITVCGVLAALSPRNRWERNKIDTENLIKYKILGGDKPLFGTYNKMIEKAERVLNEPFGYNHVNRILNGPKIKAFFDNIYNANSSEVTVDTWMLLAAMGKYMSVDERPSLSEKTYNMISSAIKDIALKVQLKPYELQAVLWCAIKRLNKPTLEDQK